MRERRTYSVGAEVMRGGVHFRVHAPKRRRVDVVLDGGRTVALSPEPGGYHAGFGDGVKPGTRYRLRLDDAVVPDPASRFQPEGPHGPSEVVDGDAFPWTDASFPGLELRGQVLYEMHVGTFTREGTYRAAMAHFEELARLGVTAIELMPVADFPGRFGWGYDGVDIYAPAHQYGRPDDLRAFVDRAHALGLGVVLDVVYNHLGPSGNYLPQLADTYFTDRYSNEWGDAVDFETDPAVRAFFVENAAYWVREFHVDGLRLDATQSMQDASPRHVLVEIAESARRAAGTKKILLIGENEPQDARLVRAGIFDAIWNDDFHHSARAAVTGTTEAYYANTKGTPQELVSAVRWGFLFQGQYYPWQKKCRGTPALDLPAPSFVLYVQNHDQVANSVSGERLHRITSAGRARAITALFLLAPGTPLLFQGQEFAASAPFVYFADHEPELARAVAKGRGDFLRQFESMKDARVEIPRPEDPATFERCKLDHAERAKHAAWVALHEDLLRLRREDPLFSAQDKDDLHGAVLDTEAFLLRFGTRGEHARLVLVNLGRDLDLAGIAEPLLAPPRGRRWRTIFSTEDPRYGGRGTPPATTCGLPRLSAHSALVLADEEVAP